MKKLFIVLTFIAVTASLSFAQDIVGDWNGKLNVGTAELRLVLHITKARRRQPEGYAGQH